MRVRGRGRHAAVVDDYLADLAAAVADVRRDPALAKTGTAPMYGMAGTLPIRRLVASRVRQMIAELHASGPRREHGPSGRTRGGR